VIPVRIVVVGAGVVGLLTAVECARAGARVDLVDRGDIPCPEATSHDSHRMVRTLHRGDAALTRAAAHLPTCWREIERRVAGRFYHPTGVLTAMAAADVDAELALLAEVGTSAWAVREPELSERYPHVRFPAGTGAVLEPAAGTVLADLALLALARWLRTHPAVRTFPRSRVVALDDAGAARLAGGGVLAGDHVVVAAGPWSRELLPAAVGADLRLWRQTMLSYTPRSSPGWAGSPGVLGLGPERDAWIMPPVAGRPARLSAASACRPAAELSDRATPGEWRDHLAGRFGGMLAGFDPAAVVGSTEGYYLDAAAGGGPVLVGLGRGAVTAYAACGGLSFKFAPPAARVLADIALDRPRRPSGLDPLDRPWRFAAGNT
jgi:glycine/D-amino acid oxidase-like deaminating enzyme